MGQLRWCNAVERRATSGTSVRDACMYFNAIKILDVYVTYDVFVLFQITLHYLGVCGKMVRDRFAPTLGGGRLTPHAHFLKEGGNWKKIRHVVNFKTIVVRMVIMC